jgi:hypothetical protein
MSALCQKRTSATRGSSEKCPPAREFSLTETRAGDGDPGRLNVTAAIGSALARCSPISIGPLYNYSMRKEQARTACQRTKIAWQGDAQFLVPVHRPCWVQMKYTTYFYRRPSNSTRRAYCFADPTLEFSTLEEVRTFGQAAGSVTQFEAGFFRIASDDRKINEHWIRDGDDWKLIPSRYKGRLARGE